MQTSKSKQTVAETRYRGTGWHPSRLPLQLQPTDTFTQWTVLYEPSPAQSPASAPAPTTAPPPDTTPAASSVPWPDYGTKLQPGSPALSVLLPGWISHHAAFSKPRTLRVSTAMAVHTHSLRHQCSIPASLHHTHTSLLSHSFFISFRLSCSGCIANHSGTICIINHFANELKQRGGKKIRHQFSKRTKKQSSKRWRCAQIHPTACLLPSLGLVRLRSQTGVSQRLGSFHGSLLITQLTWQIRGVPVFLLSSSQQLLPLFLTAQ